MAPRTNTYNRIRHLRRSSHLQQKQLNVYTPYWDSSPSSSGPRLRRDLHATYRTLESPRSSVITTDAVSRHRLGLFWPRKHATRTREARSLPRGSRGFLSTHALRSCATQSSGENSQIEAGYADTSMRDSTDSVCEEISDRSESTSSPLARDDIKVFKRLWNQRIINVSRDFKFSKEKVHSKFQISLRILKSVNHGAGRKLRVRGELECKNMVRTHCSRLRCSFI